MLSIGLVAPNMAIQINYLNRRGSMRIYVLIVFFSFPNFLLASEQSDIQVSPTFSIKIPFKLSTKVELPSLNSKLYRVSDEGFFSPQILVLHNRPKTFANKFSAERYWKKSREQTKSADKKETNKGCLQIKPRTYQCSRDVGQDGKFIAESIFWNTKNDLVLIRVTSLKSFSDARKVLEKIEINQNTRLPAGGSK